MQYKYYYCVRINSQLIDFLEANNIRYRTSGGTNVPTFVVFSLWSSFPNVQYLLDNLKRLCSSTPIITIEFSKAELENAKLLVVRPKRQSIRIINGKDAFAHSCTRVDAFGITRVGHEWQIGSIAIAKEPSIKTTTALWASETGYSELFADTRIQELAESNGLSGIEFKNVLLKNGLCSNSIYQMNSAHLITQTMIAKGHGEIIHKCPICGKEQYSIDSAYQLHLVESDNLAGSDFYVTERIFGDGIAEPLYIISQRFYQLLKKNNLAGNVIFTPVVGVSV